jgi:hypothetical protein
MNKLILLFATIGWFGISSCASTGGGGSSRLVDTFYKGKGQILFFVNNFTIKGKKSNPDINWDFTYDFHADSIRPVIINYSVYGKKFLVGPYKAEINGMAIDSVRLLFADLQGSRHRTRLSGLISFEDFKKTALANQVQFKMKYGEETFELISQKKWRRKARHIRSELLDVVKITEFQR